MKLNTVLGILTLALTASLAQAAPDATISADNAAINSACAQEAKTAGCGSDVVGKGLLKCIWEYKKANKASFELSPGCKAAMKQRHADKAAGK